MILNMMRVTPGDDHFFNRWEKAGKIYNHDQEYPVKDIKVLLIDQSICLDDAMIQWFPNLRYVVSPNTSTEHIRADLSKWMIRLVKLELGDERLKAVTAVPQFCMRTIYVQARPISSVGQNITGKVLSVIGSGRIGMELGRLAKANGMEVIFIDKHSDSSMWGYAFASADWVSLHLPSNEETKGIVGERWINLMKKTAFFINTSRPAVLDENYLCDAVHDRRIAGAHLDVTDMDLRRFYGTLTYSPHTAGRTLEDRIKTDEIALDNLLKAMRQ